jgi:hypothetical protein
MMLALDGQPSGMHWLVHCIFAVVSAGRWW